MLGGINLNLLFQYLTPQSVILFGLTSFVLVHVVPYLLDPHHIRKYPGPFFAKFTDAWFGMICKQGHRSETVHQWHLKYGTLLVQGKMRA
jgi:benzoate 4-monooxygenase